MRSLLSFFSVLVPLSLSGCALLSPVEKHWPAVPSTEAQAPAVRSDQSTTQVAPNSATAQPGSAGAQTGTTATADKPSPNAVDTNTLTLASYSERLRNLGAPELNAELARLGNSTTPQEQLQLALALAQLHQMPELIRAQDIVVKVLGNASDEATALHPLARLLAVRLGEQRRLEDLLDKQNQQVKDLQKRLDQTNERLEALKAIERSLVSRPAPVLPSPTTPAAGGIRSRSAPSPSPSLAPSRSATPQP